jgi:hypothetical protein
MIPVGGEPEGTASPGGPRGRSAAATAEGRLADIALLWVWFALVTGVVEVGIMFGFAKLVLGRTISMSSQAVWMAPVTNLVIFAIPALAIAAPHPFPGRTLSRFWADGGAGRSVPSDPVVALVTDAGTDNPAWVPIEKGDMQSVTDGRFRYIRNGDGGEELYEFRADPTEANNLAAAPGYAEVRRRLRQTLDALLGEPAKSARRDSAIARQ